MTHVEWFRAVGGAACSHTGISIFNFAAAWATSLSPRPERFTITSAFLGNWVCGVCTRPRILCGKNLHVFDGGFGTWQALTAPPKIVQVQLDGLLD